MPKALASCHVAGLSAGSSFYVLGVPLPQTGCNHLDTSADNLPHHPPLHAMARLEGVAGIPDPFYRSLRQSGPLAFVAQDFPFS